MTDRGLTHAEIKPRGREMYDAQPTRTLCAFCPWVHEGAAAEGREAYDEHKRAAHPHAVARRERVHGIKTPPAPEIDRAKLACGEECRWPRTCVSEGECQKARVDAQRAQENGRVVPPEASGADPKRGNRHSAPARDMWPRERILSLIRDHVREHGAPPTQRYFDGPTTDERPNASILGPLNAAVREAGFEPRQRGESDERWRVRTGYREEQPSEPEPEPPKAPLAAPPEPEPEPEAAAGVPSFAEVAAELEAASLDMERANHRFVDASIAFTKHPVWQGIVNTHGDDWLLEREDDR